MKRLLATVFLMLACAVLAAQDESASAPIAGPACLYSTGSDLSLTNWNPDPCVAPSCAPGGSGVPLAYAHTVGNVISGHSSMLFAETAQSSHQTNILWPYVATHSCNGANIFISHFFLYIPSTYAGNAGSGGSAASSYEMDMYSFLCGTTAVSATPPNVPIRCMFGMQRCQSGSGCPSSTVGWDLGGNSNVPWTYSGTATALNFDSWNEIYVFNHVVRAEFLSSTPPCTYVSGGTTYHVPYLYYDAIKVNGTYTAWNKKFCTNQNPPGWTSGGNQMQIDIASHPTALSVGMYIYGNVYQMSY